MANIQPRLDKFGVQFLKQNGDINDHSIRGWHLANDIYASGVFDSGVFGSIRVLGPTVPGYTLTDVNGDGWATWGPGGGGGASGFSGYSGRSGYSGFSGNSGLSGYSASSGLSGYSGFSGVGISGYSGYSGHIGVTGESGYSGYSSTSGYSGYSGMSGRSGFSGSGSSGYSGYSGLTYPWKGVWSSITSYFVNDVVERSGNTYVSIQNGTNKDPLTETAYWNLTAASGYSGYSGTNGTIGSSGYSGYSGPTGTPYWTRTATILSPTTAGDGVSIGGQLDVSSSGIFQNISTESITASGNIMIASGVPTQDYQVPSKKYVDDSIASLSLGGLKGAWEYVEYYISTTGSDVTGDGSTGNPFATIQHAIDIIPSNLGNKGVYIYLKDGSYSQSTSIYNFYNGYIYILSESQDRTKVDITGSWVFDVEYCDEVGFYDLTLVCDTNSIACIYGYDVRQLDCYRIAVGTDGIATGVKGFWADNACLLRVRSCVDGANPVAKGLYEFNSGIIHINNTSSIGTIPFTGRLCIDEYNDHVGFGRIPADNILEIECATENGIRFRRAATSEVGTITFNGATTNTTMKFYLAYNTLGNYLWVSGANQLMELVGGTGLGIGCAPDRALKVSGDSYITGDFVVGGQFTASGVSRFEDHADFVDNNILTTGEVGASGSPVASGWYSYLDVLNAPTASGVPIPTIASVNDLTNKRIVPRVVSTTDDSTAVIDVGVTDQYQLTAVSNATNFSTTGTAVAGQKLIIRFKDAGVAKAITWDGIFRVIGVTAPTTTVANKTTYVGCIYNYTDTKWDIVAVGTEA